MSKPSNSSPLPWAADGEGIRKLIRASDMVIVASRHRLPKEIHEDNFDLIVRAVNAHADLVGALAEVMDWISNWDPNFIHDEEWGGTAERARAAIAKAKGEEG